MLLRILTHCVARRLVLTAGHCVGAEDFLPYMGSARPANFRQLGLNFTSFPNTYVVNSSKSARLGLSFPCLNLCSGRLCIGT